MFEHVVYGSVSRVGTLQEFFYVWVGRGLGKGFEGCAQGSWHVGAYRGGAI